MKLQILLPLFALLTGVTALADSIEYNTVGSVFDCTGTPSGVTGCGGTTITLDNIIILSYAPNTDSIVSVANGSHTFSNLGNIWVSCVDGTKTCATEIIPVGLTLAIVINQLAPDAITSYLQPAAVTGRLAGSSSAGQLQWPDAAGVTIDGQNATVNYVVHPLTLNLNPPSTCYVNCGETSIQGQISDTSVAINTSVVPEPAISLLIAGGLVAIGSTRRRRTGK